MKGKKLTKNIRIEEIINRKKDSSYDWQRDVRGEINQKRNTKELNGKIERKNLLYVIEKKKE